MCLDSEVLGESHPLVTARTRALCKCLCGNGRIRIQVRLDAVDSMAIGADRRLPVALFDCLAVDASHELLLHTVVTLRAGSRNIELEDRRLWIARRKNVMNAMAVGTDCCLVRTGSNRLSVHALLVRNKRSRAQSG